ncbi:hypothetical protein FHX81_0425 [Saccharothrix saharensis]|uniref:Uncharacterized protein n=1 Tax=Saccharothrix saharensis TaxID=571190 RepID=A0A543J5R1_9PSEU|nr:hypothetical protein [Saccharothrix saharensis]TQM78169.1 hypothetical protein FHX81_0425 [Saccharothrix saharensis]
MTAQKTTTITARVSIEFAQFVLFDYTGQATTTDLLARRTPGWIAVAGPGGAVFNAAGRQSLAADVTLELWTDTPPDDPTDPHMVTERFDGEFTVDTEQILLACTTGSPNDVTVHLPHPGAYRLRAHRRKQTAEDVAPTDTWTLQIWPA